MKRFAIPCVAAMLAACGGGGSLGDSTTVSGQIQNWSHGTSYVMTAAVGSQDVATGAIDATGKFSVTLPGAATVTADLAATSAFTMNFGAGCTGALNSSTPGVKVGAAGFSAKGPMDQLALALSAGTFTLGGSIDITTATYYYVDQDSTLSGQVSCNSMGTSATLSANMDLKKGWNTVIGHITGSASASGGSLNESLSTGPIPANLQWGENKGLGF